MGLKLVRGAKNEICVDYNARNIEYESVRNSNTALFKVEQHYLPHKLYKNSKILSRQSNNNNFQLF